MDADDIKKRESLYAGEQEVENLTEGGVRESEVRRLVVFRLSDEVYAIPIGDVTEIREVQPVTPLPHMPSYVLGLMNLRGAIVPVVDLRRKFDLPISPPHASNRLVILKAADYQVALQVDAVEGLARLPESAFLPAPHGVARIDPEYYSQVAMVNDTMIIELDIQRMLSQTAAAGRASRE